MNIAIFTPNQNSYSETFIQVHKNYLKDKVFFYYGIGENIKIENQKKIIPTTQRYKIKLIAKLFKKPTNYRRNMILLKSLKANKIDVVLVEYGTHAHSLREALKLSQLPVVVYFHGYDASIKAVIKNCNFYKEVFSLAYNIVAVSKVMMESLKEMGCPKEKIVYNPCAPNNNFFDLVPKYSKKQFVSIGRFTDKKAPYYTIIAFNGVLKKHPDAQLLMAGDGLLLNTCENLIKYYKLEEKVKLLGVIEPVEYQNILSDSLAFVQHSITSKNGDMEGTPVSVLEASIAGLPVISTYHAGISDVIVHKKTGLLSEEHDVDSMSNHMLQVLDDITFAQELGNNGKAHIYKYYSLNKHIHKLQTVINNAATNNNRV